MRARWMRSPPRGGRRPISFRAMYWPLIGGFIAVVVITILIGWILDISRRGDADNQGH